MDASPECQSIALRPGQTLVAEVVRRDAQDPAQPRFNHFHPQAEIVWFRQARGTLRLGGTAVALGPGMLVWLPPMAPHDFEVEAGPRDWVLIQFAPARLDRAALGLGLSLPDSAALLLPDGQSTARLNLLGEWLSQVAGEPARAEMAHRLLDLILSIVAAASPIEGQSVPGGASISRLAPAIRLIQSDPARPLAMAEAARACSLTPAYFSRLFKARMRMGFADYLQGHRLNLAAEIIASTDLPIAQVAYRVGIASPAHLSRSFAARFGMSPRDYRHRARRHAAGPAPAQAQASFSPAPRKPEA